MKKFKKHIMVSAILLMFLLVSSTSVAFGQKNQVEYKKAAQAETADTLTKRNTSVSVFGQQRQEEKKTYGIGFQTLHSVGNTGNTISVWGVSGMADVTPNMSIQVIIAPFGPGLSEPFGDPKMYAGKVIYRVKKKLYWNIYGYGMVSASDYYEEEKTFIFGAWGGTGIEYNLKALYSKLPSIAWNFEVEVGTVNFKGIDIITELGAHYRF